MLIDLPPTKKKAGGRPLSETAAGPWDGAKAVRAMVALLSMPSPQEALDDFMSQLDGDVRRVAPGEWGITVSVSGWPLHVGVAVRDGLVRAQALVAGPGAVDPHQLLFWNRQTVLVRFAHTRAGEVHVMGELPEVAATPGELDRLLGLLVAAAEAARGHLQRS
jgi:hypothetical protein